MFSEKVVADRYHAYIPLRIIVKSLPLQLWKIDHDLSLLNRDLGKLCL